ncbi:MAG: RNA polymerase sigma factor [Alphaproteobacteria bacterium]|nr:RNA polymerase sigma factor [Alphaproteobacteria bacterium]
MLQPLLSPQSDDVLMGRLRGGNGDAFAELLGRHLGAVARFSYHMIGNAADADEIAQETFLRLWRGRERWEPRAQVRTWLLRVARNLCIDRFRRREVVTDEFPDLPDLRPTPAGNLQARETERIVAKALAELPERQRAAIGLVYYEGLSNIEAAQVLDVSIDALESLLARGRRSLRSNLSALHPHLGEM